MKELRKTNLPRQISKGDATRRDRAGRTKASGQRHSSPVSVSAFPSSAEERSLSAKAEHHSWVLHEQDLYDLAPVGFFTLDRRGNILRLNKAAARLLGFPEQWLHDRSFLVFVARSDLRRFVSLLTHIRRFRDHQETFEVELSINGGSVPVQISIKSSINQGQLIYRMAVLDLTETKAIERELKDTLGNWYSLVDSAPDIIMTVDRKGKITFTNRGAWGIPGRALLGTRLTDYVSDEDRPKLQKCIDTAFRFNKSSICEVSDVNGEKERWYSLSFGAVREPKRLTTTTTTVTIRDVTRHKRTEDVLRASREQLREFAARLDQVREEERTRVAREIHDDLGQALTIFKMDLAWLQGKTKGADVARKKIKAMIRDVDQTIERFRRIVSELRPSILDEMGLTAALEWQVAQIQQRTGIRCIFETTKEDFNLPPDTAAALFRVVQEALTNVVRHAGARQVRVVLRPAADILRIAITDDGKGLARNRVDDRKSFGIVGMRERVHRIGGEFKIFSGPGRGTRLEIAAPLK